MKTKIASIGLVLLLIAALVQITNIVQDRARYRYAAVQNMAQSLAGAQTLTGPLIHRACTEEWEVRGSDKQLRTERRDFVLAAAPALLALKGNTQLEPRAGGLHATQVFTLKANVTAQWADLSALKPVATHGSSRMSCGQPLLMLAVSDARGVRHAVAKVGEQTLALKPGTFFGTLPRGVHAALSPSVLGDLPVQADFELELVGTESLSVVPMGGDTQVHFTSNWPHPSFGGQFLPVERKVTDKGFEASWRVSALASTAQQDVKQSPVDEKSKPAAACAVAADALSSGDCIEAFGVTFVDPSDTYALSDKATKYGMLFIGLRFLAVGLFESMKSLRVHPFNTCWWARPCACSFCCW